MRLSDKCTPKEYADAKKDFEDYIKKGFPKDHKLAGNNHMVIAPRVYGRSVLRKIVEDM